MFFVADGARAARKFGEAMVMWKIIFLASNEENSSGRNRFNTLNESDSAGQARGNEKMPAGLRNHLDESRVSVAVHISEPVSAATAFKIGDDSRASSCSATKAPSGPRWRKSQVEVTVPGEPSTAYDRRCVITAHGVKILPGINDEGVRVVHVEQFRIALGGPPSNPRWRADHADPRILHGPGARGRGASTSIPTRSPSSSPDSSNHR